jgi:iron complex transport system substrate-binding protein
MPKVDRQLKSISSYAFSATSQRKSGPRGAAKIPEIHLSPCEDGKEFLQSPSPLPSPLNGEGISILLCPPSPLAGEGRVRGAGAWGNFAGRFFFLLVFPLLFIAPDSFCATFTDEVGRKVELPGPPQRLISVAPSVTEVLFALGLGEKVVGVSTYCNYPPEALKKEKVGGYITPSLEKIVALRPDLVIGTADGNLKSFVNKLSGLGVPVYISNPRSVSEVLTSIRRIGEVTFSQPAAQRVVDSMKGKMETVREKVQGRPRSRVLHVLAYDPLISSGKGTFVDDLIRFAGGVNIAEGAEGKHPRYSMEEVIAQDPEVIILSSMKSKDPLADQRQWWERWKEISAVRSGRIYVIDSDLILRPSPRIVEGLEEVARAIHPGAFKNANFKMQNAK